MSKPWLFWLVACAKLLALIYGRVAKRQPGHKAEFGVGVCFQVDVQMQAQSPAHPTTQPLWIMELRLKCLIYKHVQLNYLAPVEIAMPLE